MQPYMQRSFLKYLCVLLDGVVGTYIIKVEYQNLFEGYNDYNYISLEGFQCILELKWHNKINVSIAISDKSNFVVILGNYSYLVIVQEAIHAQYAFMHYNSVKNDINKKAQRRNLTQYSYQINLFLFFLSNFFNLDKYICL